jgi:mono/diheme cytochrome c family protein
MKRALVRALAVAGALAIVLGGLVSWCAVDGIPRYRPPAFDATIARTPERIARGRKIVHLLCLNCHFDVRTGRLSGQRLDDGPPELGDVFARNITQHRQRGIGAWSDGEIVVLLRTGIARDGRYTPPWMPKLAHASDEDIASIVAFLRSDDPLVQPSDAVNRACRPSLLSKLLAHSKWKPLPMPSQPIVAPPTSDTIAYGRYLVGALECFTCHSADFKSIDVAQPERTPGYLGGGNALRDLGGGVVYSANLTFDEETGIGRWSESEFSRALRDGIRPDNTVVRYPMTPMRELDDAEVGALYAYLATVPKLRAARRARPPQPPLAAGASDGKRAYYRYGCNSCHGDEGVGRGDLRGANRNYPSDVALTRWIRNAPSLKPDTRMPTWDGVVAESDYAPLVGYVRLLSRRGGGEASEPAR